MAFQSIAADRPLSDPLRDLPRSALPRLCRRSSSKWDHHRWGVETRGLRYSCGGQVAPWSWEAGDVSSNQPGLWPLPGHPLLPRHGETKQLFYISISDMYLFKVVVFFTVSIGIFCMSLFKGPCEDLTCFPPDVKCFGLCDVGTVTVPLIHNTTIRQQPANFLDLERAYSDFATDFITTYAKKGQPFFLYYPSHVSNRKEVCFFSQKSQL